MPSELDSSHRRWCQMTARRVLPGYSAAAGVLTRQEELPSLVDARLAGNQEAGRGGRVVRSGRSRKDQRGA